MTSTQDLGWLLANFADRVPGVAHAIAVSADGLLLASSRDLPRDRADQLAAIASGLVSLTRGAARCFDAEPVVQTIVETAGGYFFAAGQTAGIGVRINPKLDIEKVITELKVGEALVSLLQADGSPTPVERTSRSISRNCSTPNGSPFWSRGRMSGAQRLTLA